MNIDALMSVYFSKKMTLPAVMDDTRLSFISFQAAEG